MVMAKYNGSSQILESILGTGTGSIVPRPVKFRNEVQIVAIKANRLSSLYCQLIAY